jgi:hypothetical protein
MGPDDKKYGGANAFRQAVYLEGKGSWGKLPLFFS